MNNNKRWKIKKLYDDPIDNEDLAATTDLKYYKILINNHEINCNIKIVKKKKYIVVFSSNKTPFCLVKALKLSDDQYAEFIQLAKDEQSNYE